MKSKISKGFIARSFKDENLMGGTIIDRVEREIVINDELVTYVEGMTDRNKMSRDNPAGLIGFSKVHFVGGDVVLVEQQYDKVADYLFDYTTTIDHIDGYPDPGPSDHEIGQMRRNRPEDLLS